MQYHVSRLQGENGIRVGGNSSSQAKPVREMAASMLALQGTVAKIFTVQLEYD